MTVTTTDAPSSPTSGRPDLCAYAWREMNASDGVYRAWRRAYAGRFEEIMLINQSGDDLRVDPNLFSANYLRPLIDDLVHSLEISNFTVAEDVTTPAPAAPAAPVTDGTTPTDPAAAAADVQANAAAVAAKAVADAAAKSAADAAVVTFRHAWDAQRMPTRAPNVHRAARIDGDAFVLVWEGNDPGTVRVDFNSATDMRAFYVPGTDDEIDFVAKRWQHRTGVWRINLYFADRIEKFIHTDEVQANVEPTVYGSREEDWTKFYEDGNASATFIDPLTGEEVETDQDLTDSTGNAVKLWPLPNPLGRIPIVVFSNRLDPFSPYGISDIENAIRLQNALNKLDAGEFLAHDFMTKRARVVLHNDDSDYARFASGRAPDPLSDPDDPYDESGEVEAQSRAEKTLKVLPGDVIDVIGASLHELSTEEPAGYLASKKDKLAAFAVTNGMSLLHVLPDQTAITGEAYRRSAMMNAIKKQAARRDFGAAWAQVAELMSFWLDLGEIKLRPEWAHDDSIDISEFWDTVDAKLKLGIPTETVMLEAGYPASQVDGWAAEKQRKAAIVAAQLASNPVLANSMQVDGAPINGAAPATQTTPASAGVPAAPTAS